ncbi:MAG: hypothetical protein AAF614_40835 [Chloroflexota bacterium]
MWIFASGAMGAMQVQKVLEEWSYLSCACIIQGNERIFVTTGEAIGANGRC